MGRAEDATSSLVEALSSREKQIAHVKRVLEAIEASIEKRASETHQELEIYGVAGTRRVKEMSLTELITAREKYLLELKRLERGSNAKYPKNVVFRFR